MTSVDTCHFSSSGVGTSLTLAFDHLRSCSQKQVSLPRVWIVSVLVWSNHVTPGR